MFARSLFFDAELPLVDLNEVFRDGLHRITVAQEMLVSRSEHALDLGQFRLNLIRHVGVEVFVTVRLVLSNHKKVLVILTNEDALGTKDIPGATLLLRFADLAHREGDGDFGEV